MLGVYGLAGAGRTRFCRTLYGLEKMTGGQIVLDGRPYRPSSPAFAIGQGIAYLTEERKKDGFIPNMSSLTNAVLPILRRFRQGGMINHRQADQRARSILHSLHTLGALRGPMQSLSGGNQQKVLFARVIGQQAKLILLDEPTKGVDIGAKADIYRIIRRLADDGCCVIMVSSEEEELLDVADVITVFRHGRCDGALYPVSALTPAMLRKAAWDAEPAVA
ncbi:ATP-binding cassette domain-containing protein [Acerihabitans sp. KWT182]|uniref:ATP-binding cassette domain-containing protein n=1 Tax=Acerihabitans sp. KWT182 TaxID=3157919 RepID=A0AAU7QFX9_9GAMM